jgi:hypothetical protein
MGAISMAGLGAEVGLPALPVLAGAAGAVITIGKAASASPKIEPIILPKMLIPTSFSVARSAVEILTAL